MGVRTVMATRYVTPLREGGSLPAIVEADDDGMYVLKFRGAGQGPKALIAEFVAGEIARALGLPVPEIVFAEYGSTEPQKVHGANDHGAYRRHLRGECEAQPISIRSIPLAPAIG